MWDAMRVGPSTSPLLVSEGWLLFYFGLDHDDSYQVGAALLDRYNPAKVIARSKEPVLRPILEWERVGRRADTVFPCGVEVVDETQSIRLYYGAADTCIGSAEAPLTELMGSLLVEK